jgi:hypothetical protein
LTVFRSVGGCFSFFILFLSKRLTFSDSFITMKSKERIGSSSVGIKDDLPTPAYVGGADGSLVPKLHDPRRKKVS